MATKKVKKILCGSCGRVVAVRGAVWEYRLRPGGFGSARNADGLYTRWNCDACVDGAVEY